MLRSTTAVATLTAFLALTLPAGHARAESPPRGEVRTPGDGDDPALAEAKSHFVSGKTAYDAGDFQSAVSEFKAAQRIKYSPKLEYNIAACYERMGRAKAAAKHYRRYLDEMPQAANRAEVEQKLPTLDAQATQQAAQAARGDELAPSEAPVDGQAAPGRRTSAGYAAAEEPPPAPAKKSKSYWWIVFPIVGGVVLMSLLVWYEYSLTSTTLYGRARDDQPAPPAGEPLFRF